MQRRSLLPDRVNRVRVKHDENTKS